MKMLIWKEWRTAGNFIFTCLFGVITSFIIWNSAIGSTYPSNYGVDLHSNNPLKEQYFVQYNADQNQYRTVHTAVFFFNMMQLGIFGYWVSTIIWISSQIFAGETEKGTLILLGTLAFSRSGIWLRKVAINFLFIAVSILSSYFLLQILISCTPSVQVVSHIRINDLMMKIYQDELGMGDRKLASLIKFPLGDWNVDTCLHFVILALSAFSICSFASTICRSLALAASTAVFATSAWIAGLCFILLQAGFSFDHGVIPIIVDLITVPLFLGMSYQVFVHGETLQTEKRFQVLAQSMKWVLPTLVSEAMVIFAVHQIFRIGVH